MGVLFTNNAVAVLAAAIDAAATELQVQAGFGVRYPQPDSSGDWFPVTLIDFLGNMEITRCTARSGDTLTVERAQEGTIARAFPMGGRVDHRLTAKALEEIAFSTFIGESPPEDPQARQLWFETDTGNTHIYYDDGDSAQWVQIAGQSLGGAPSDIVFSTRDALVAGVAGGFFVQDGEVLTVEGHDYIGKSGATTIPDLPGFLPHRDWWLGHFGPNTAATFNLAVPIAVTAKRTLRISNEPVLCAEVIRIENLAADAIVDIEMEPGGKFVADPALATGSFVQIGNDPTVGPLTVYFPSGNATPLEEHPTTDFSVNAVIGDSIFTVTDASTIPVGAILLAKAQRLDMRGESRSYVCHGETNQCIAKTGNVLSLRYPVADNYSNDILWSGVTTGVGTARTIPLAPGLDTDKIIGARMVVTTGGVPQTRYLTRYNTVTGLGELWDDSSLGTQADFSPIPAAGDAVVLDQKPYLFWMPSFKKLYLNGLEFEGNDTHAVERCLQIGGAADMLISDCGCDKIPVSFLHLSQCLSPHIYRPKPRNVNATSLGYGILPVACRDVWCYDPDSFNCRRFGPDSGGYTPTWGMTCLGGTITGGVLDGDGVPWGPDNPQGALGEHGHARNYTYDGQTVLLNVGSIGVERGFNTTFRNIRSKGKLTTGYSMSGYNGRVLNCEHDGDLMGNTNIVMPTDPEARGHFIYSTSNFQGLMEIRGNRCNDLTGDLLYVRTGATITSIPDRFKGKVVMRDNIIDWVSANYRSIIAGYDVFPFHGFDIETPVWSIKGGGGISFYGNQTAFTTGRDSNIWKLDGRYRVSIGQDKVAQIPLYVNQSQILIRAFPISSVGTNIVDILLRRNSATFTNQGVTSANIKASATTPVPPTFVGAAGEVTFNLSGSNVVPSIITIENRFAGELNWMMEIVAY